MKRVISSISFIVGIIAFGIFLIDLFTCDGFTFGIPALIVFSICFIWFIFSKNKKDVFVDIWTILEIIFDIN